MRKIHFALISLSIFCSSVFAQNDTMYIMKSGVVVGKYDIYTQVDSVIFYQPAPSANTFTDPRDGNVYQIVTIGAQIWMAENLKYLPMVSGPGQGSWTEPYYYVYGYDGSNVEDAKATANYNTYGVLYNWAAALEACPAGWYLPDDAAWCQLSEFLDEAADCGAIGAESSIAGGKLKETGTTHWASPNTGATNETGFTALPGGGRGFNGVWTNDIIYTGYWWSATEYTVYPSNALFRYLSYNNTEVSRYNTQQDAGLSVRCVKN